MDLQPANDLNVESPLTGTATLTKPASSTTLAIAKADSTRDTIEAASLDRISTQSGRTADLFSLLNRRRPLSGLLRLLPVRRNILWVSLKETLTAQKLCKLKKNRAYSSLTTLRRFVQWRTCAFLYEKTSFTERVLIAVVQLRSTSGMTV